MSDVGYWGPQAGSMPEFAALLRAEWERRGYTFVEGDDPDATVVFNFINPDKPKPFRRRRRSTYVVAVQRLERVPENVLRYEYPMLVRALANLGMVLVPGDGCYFVTPEQGCYRVDDPGDQAAWVTAIVDRILPLATARLVIDNRFDADLESELWGGDEHTAALHRAGKRLDALGLLPAPFPLEEIVEEKELRAIKRIYGIGGLY